MATLGQFARKMRIIGDRLEMNVNSAVKKVVIAVDQAVVLGTPVDKGPARSNWQVSLGQAKTDVISAYAPGNKLGVSESANAQGALDQGRAAVAGRQEGQDVYISNNIPYIGKLNDGSSAQAPANFVEQAALAGAQVVKNVKVLGRRIV